MREEIKEKVWKVSELNQLVKEILESSLSYPIWLEGEISNLSINRSSGHVYMTIKDEQCQIRAAFFGGESEARKLELKDGVKAEFFGKVSLYLVRGEYQFCISKIRLKGIGDLYKKFEELKEKLQKEGLFDQSRKKALPRLPTRIGVVTSPEGAAIRDFLRVVLNRFPNLHIRIYPSAVQGKGAEKEIAAGIEFFNKIWKPDVIVITRGGGSIEDLWAFNEESLARVIAESKVPIISAVGHEVDFTIADFVADLRAPTPTAAAEMIVEKEEAFANTIAEFKRRTEMALRLSLEKAKNTLAKLKGSKVFVDPLLLIRDRQQYIDELSDRILNSMRDRLQKAKLHFELLNAKIATMSPYKVLERGYSILKRKSNGSIVFDDSVSSGEELIAIVHKGKIDLIVK